MPCTRGLLSALALGVALESPAGAQNLVLNPDFDTDLSHWTIDTSFAVQAQIFVGLNSGPNCTVPVTLQSSDVE